MTDEQIKQNAEEYAKERCIRYNEQYGACYDAYISGAHSRDEEIKGYQAQINMTADALQRCMDELNQLRNPWISVKDRLPEDNKTVLLWFGGYYTAAILRDGEWWNCTGWHSGGGWSALDKIQDIAASYITHWMYIPEPPEQDPTVSERIIERLKV